MKLSRPLRQIEERLGDRGVRLTTARRAVVAALDDAEGPMSAAELHQSMSSQVPLSSVYRSLAVLEEAEVLAPHHGARGLTRYELAEWLTGHHHHLVCVSCGSIEDITVQATVEEQLRSVVTELAKDSGFQATGHELEVEGLCRRCG